MTGRPRLGILWFVPRADGTSRLLELSLPADEVPLVGGFRTLETGHVRFWREAVRKDPSLRGVPYEAYPRGRANWRGEDDAWLLLLDRRLIRPEYVDVVVDAWALPRDRLKVMGDPHYRSPLAVGPPRKDG